MTDLFLIFMFILVQILELVIIGGFVLRFGCSLLFFLLLFYFFILIVLFYFSFIFSHFSSDPCI